MIVRDILRDANPATSSGKIIAHGPMVVMVGKDLCLLAVARQGANAAGHEDVHVALEPKEADEFCRIWSDYRKTGKVSLR